MKRKRRKLPTLMFHDKETLHKERRQHTANIALIVAHGLSSDATKGRIREAIDLYAETVQMSQEPDEKPGPQSIG